MLWTQPAESAFAVGFIAVGAVVYGLLFARRQ
jgi:hypothetical protein